MDEWWLLLWWQAWQWFSPGIAFAAIPGSDGTISACFKKTTKILRVINAEDGQKCRSDERPLSWNQEGPAGPSGSPGLPGPSGSPGPQGPAVCAFGDLAADPFIEHAHRLSTRLAQQV